MTTLSFKVWLIVMFLCASFPRPVDYGYTEHSAVCIKVDQSSSDVAFMNGQKEVFHLGGHEGWSDGDVATIVVDENGTVITATCEGKVWNYDNHGTFTNVSYPWHYEGAKPTTVHTH